MDLNCEKRKVDLDFLYLICIGTDVTKTITVHLGSFERLGSGASKILVVLVCMYYALEIQVT